MIFDNHTQSKHHARQEAGPPGATNTRRPLTTATETTVAVGASAINCCYPALISF